MPGRGNLPAPGFLETIKGLMPDMEGIFADMSRRISIKDYTGDQASLEVSLQKIQKYVARAEGSQSARLFRGLGKVPSGT